jgi:hypothetical protein
MPGLLRGVARTAVIAGTASAVSGRVQRRQAEKFADRDANIYAERQQAYQQQAAPTYPPPATPPQAPAPAGQVDVIDQLTRRGELHKQGVLRDDEFAAAMAKLRGS